MFFGFNFGPPELLTEKELQISANLLPDFIKEILKEFNVNELEVVTKFSGLPQFDVIIKRCKLSPYQYDIIFKWFEKKNEEILQSEERILSEIQKDIENNKFYMLHLLVHMERLVSSRKSSNKYFRENYEKDLKYLEID